MPEQTTMTPDEFSRLIINIVRSTYSQANYNSKENCNKQQALICDVKAYYNGVYAELLALRVERTASQPLVDALVSYPEYPETLRRTDACWQSGDEGGIPFDAEEVPLP